MIIATAGGLAAGAGLAWGLGARRRGRGDRDWHTRLAARDEELRETRESLSGATAELDDLRAELRRLRVLLARAETAREAAPAPSDTAAPDLLEAREREPDVVQEESAPLPSGDRAPSNGPSARDRIEELEAELATLESLRCPDPAAHRSDPDTQAPAGSSGAR